MGPCNPPTPLTPIPTHGRRRHRTRMDGPPPLTGIHRRCMCRRRPGHRLLRRLQHLSRLQLIQGSVHLLQLPTGPALNAVPPAGRGTRAWWALGAGGLVAGASQRAQRSRAAASSALAAARGRLRYAHLQARFSVVGQMPRRAAASLRPTPKWLCRSASVSRTPGLPAGQVATGGARMGSAGAVLGEARHEQGQKGSRQSVRAQRARPMAACPQRIQAMAFAQREQLSDATAPVGSCAPCFRAT